MNPRDNARRFALLKAELLAAARAAVAKLTDEQCEVIYFAIEELLAASASATASIATPIEGRAEVSTTIAFRIAKLLEVSLHDVLQGTALPKDLCPHCGREI
jgi:hypothetical protein